jgi:iron complex transport system ATP-binding protein
LNNQPISDFDTKILSKKIAIVNTKPTLFGKHTVSDVLFLGRLPYQNMFASKSKEDEVIVQNVIDKLGLSGLKNELFTQLSDGEKQLVMIGRALVQDTQIILLDEPSAFLDVVNQFKILEILAKISIADKKLILFSTHQIESLQQYCEKVLLISNNEMKLLQNKQNYSALIKASFGINNY